MTVVILDGKNIHDEDLQNVGEALKANKTLETLDLDNNNTLTRCTRYWWIFENVQNINNFVTR